MQFGMHGFSTNSFGQHVDLRLMSGFSGPTWSEPQLNLESLDDVLALIIKQPRGKAFNKIDNPSVSQRDLSKHSHTSQLPHDRKLSGLLASSVSPSGHSKVARAATMGAGTRDMLRNDGSLDTGTLVDSTMVSLQRTHAWTHAWTCTACGAPLACAPWRGTETIL